MNYSRQATYLSMLKNDSRAPLLFFVIIAGVVALVVFYDLYLSKIKSRDLTRKRDLAKVQQALESYYTEHKAYPPASTLELPRDPVGLLNYSYKTSIDRQKYHLLARIENTKDTEYVRGLDGDCGASCTYGVTNPGGRLTEELK